VPDMQTSPNGPHSSDTRAPSPCRATPNRLIEAAEGLFAAHGFEGTSMRALACRAGTSVSAAGYHFGGKRGVVRAVVERHLSPINAQREAEVERLIRACDVAQPTLEAVLVAYFRPSFDAWLAAEARSQSGVPNIEARLHTDPHPLIAELKEELCRPVLDRYVEVLARILPAQTRPQLAVGVEFASGLLVHVLGGQIAARGLAAEAVFERLVAFSAAGLRAEISETTAAHCVAVANPARRAEVA
jgi:AcrR family transcriptional regulator